MMPPRPPRVLVVDGSALMRQALSRLLRQAGLDVVGTACGGSEAVERVRALEPDVVSLDIATPPTEGLATLERLLALGSVPVVVCGDVTADAAEATFRALQIGAVDAVVRPRSGPSLDEVGADLARKVWAAAGARSTPPPQPAPRELASVPRPTPPAPIGRDVLRLIVIATSTGGPNALGKVIGALPADLPAALLVVQHMPAGFTASLARRLDDHSALTVREAADGDQPSAGLVLLAPGNLHLDLEADGRVALSSAPPEHGVRPAADVTLRAAVRFHPGAVDLVVLTGMGSDGTAGARAVRATGGRVIAEAESTAVIWGMPGSVVEAGLADEVVALPDVAARIVALAARPSPGP
jgi:two-component system chemotaxis response regulator CheB